VKRDERYSDVFVEVLDLTEFEDAVMEFSQRRYADETVVSIAPRYKYGRVETARGLVILLDEGVGYGPLSETESAKIVFLPRFARGKWFIDSSVILPLEVGVCSEYV